MDLLDYLFAPRSDYSSASLQVSPTKSSPPSITTVATNTTPTSTTGSTTTATPPKTSVQTPWNYSSLSSFVFPQSMKEKSPPQSPVNSNRTQQQKQDNKEKISPVVPAKPRVSVAEKTKLIVQEISQIKLDLPKLRQLAFEGLPEGELKAIYWRVLLNYLPLNRTQWPSVLSSQRKLYYELVAELRSTPQKKEEMQENTTEEATDHPLNQSKLSQWNEFFNENNTINQIEKDVHRTFPHLHFFQLEESATDNEAVAIPLTNHHARALRSILFLYSKLNSGISYVQGMNEIVGPIYYVFATDPNQEFAAHAEPDAFFCFVNLMGEIKDSFVKTLDHSKVGIRQKMRDLNNLLRIKDFEVWENLEKKQLSPEFYTFRWLTLLLSQEFELPDVLRLWDSLFSDEARFQYLLYVCLAMIINIRSQLLSLDFAESLKLLQAYPPTNIHKILELANEISSSSYGCIPNGEDDNGYDYSKYLKKAQDMIAELIG